MASFSKRWVVGIDEAGRGPLAGPVTLAAILCPKRTAAAFFRNIMDSKHLPARAREEWFEKIKKHPRIFYFVSSVGPVIVDRAGIMGAVDMAIRRILRKMEHLGNVRCEVLLDGGLKAPENYIQKTIIKGDEGILVIAAASIIAKVTRDRKMARISKKFPKYAFEAHKGYGTRLHYKMLKKHGPCEIHRRTFLKNFKFRI